MRTIGAFLLAAFSATIAAGGDQLPPVDSPGMKRFADRFLELIRDPNSKTFRAVADVSRMSSEATAFIKSINSKGNGLDERLVEEWLASLESACDSSWETVEVKKTLAAKDGVATIRLRLKNADGLQADYLAWVAANGEERRLIDLQSLPSGMSFAKQTYLVFAGVAARELAQDFRAVSAGSKSDPRPGLSRVAALEREPLRLYRDRLYLEWAGDADRPKAVLRLAGKLNHRFDEDAAVAWLSAKAHYHLEQHRECIRCVEWYESLAGKDSWSRLLRAKSLKQEGRFGEARKEYAEALKDNPLSVEAAIDLFEATSAKEKAKAAELLPKEDAFEAIAWTLGSTLSSAGDVAGLSAVVDYAEKIGATDVVTAYLRGELLLAQGKPTEAAEAVVKHLPDSDEEADDADDVLDLYCEAMHRLGKVESAYDQASSTPKKAFASIADKLDKEKDAATLEKIGAKHCSNHSADGAGALTFAHFLFGRKKYQEAGAVIDRFLATPDSAHTEDAPSLRRLRIRISLAENKTNDVLKFIGEDEDLFEFAAEELAEADRGAELVKFLDGFAARAKTPAVFANWKAESAFLSKNYQLAFTYLVHLADPNGITKKVEIDSRRRLLFVRTMIRLGNKSGLAAFAEKTLSPDDELGFALAYAAVGDVKKLEVALEDCLEAGIGEREILDDPDLGPLLESPALAKLRDKVLLDRELNP